MNTSLSRTFSGLAAAVTFAWAAAVAPAAVAAPINYSFTVVGLPGAGGSFGFESSSGVGNSSGQTEYVLTSFSFSVGGTTFGLAGLDGDIGWALFDGSVLLGIEGVSDDLAFSFLPGGEGLAAYVTLKSALVGATVSGRSLPYRTFDLNFVQSDNVVPAPGSSALSLLALAMASVALRRRKSST